MFALVDCNNFFVSCEKVFRPELEGKPVAVLSNNDGCVVARSQEVKKLGITMAAPIFKYKDLVEKHKIILFSGNFPLYGDFSNRIMAILRDYAPRMQVYSIDEAFLELPDWPPSKLSAHARRIRAIIKQWTGIPVSIGIGPTKTLAKVANEWAKTSPKSQGVVNCLEFADLDETLRTLPVQEIWGVGWRLSASLKNFGIFNAYQLKSAPDAWIKKQLSVSVFRTVLELRGTSCFSLHHDVSTRKSILTSRSFGYPVMTFTELREAVSSYACRAAEKLRQEKLAATYLTVFIETNRFADNDRYAKSFTYTLKESSNYNPHLLEVADLALTRIYKPGLAYKRAGVLMQGLVPETQVQLNFFASPGDPQKQRKIMQALDTINAKWGRRCIRYAATGLNKPWRLKQEHRSPRYTTSWNELYKINSFC